MNRIDVGIWRRIGLIEALASDGTPVSAAHNVKAVASDVVTARAEQMSRIAA